MKCHEMQRISLGFIQKIPLILHEIQINSEISFISSLKKAEFHKELPIFRMKNNTLFESSLIEAKKKGNPSFYFQNQNQS